MNDEALQNWPNWIRWTLAWPAALIGSLLIAGVFRMFQSGVDQHMAPWFLDLLQAGIIGYLFVYIGAWFAPKHKKVISIVNLCILCGIICMGIGVVLLGMSYGTKLDTPFLFFLGTAIYITGAVIATVQVHSEVAS